MKPNKRTYRTDGAACVNCGALIDAASAVKRPHRAPKAGDIAICLYCSHVMIYDDKRAPRNPTDDELIEIAGREDISRALALLAEGRRREAAQGPTRES